ncbi:Gfo/Idh/MocA family oxidoreductase [soil metagenome]
MEDDKKKNISLSRRRFLEKAAAVSAFFIVPRCVLGGQGYLAPSDRITLGFIGTGKQSGSLLSKFNGTGQVQIMAASEVYANKLAHFQQQVQRHARTGTRGPSHQGCQPYTDFREILLRPDVDAVVIATPDHWHAVQAVLAARAGKDIYCEKPLSLTINEGRAMVEAARKHNRVFQTGSMQRSWPEFRQAVELVRHGYIGEVRKVHVSVGDPPKDFDLPEEQVPAGLNWDRWLGPNLYHPYHKELAPSLEMNIWARWRYYKGLGGGDVTDWGAHMFDIAQWGLDRDHSGPTDIIPPNGQDVPHLTMRYSNGTSVLHVPSASDRSVTFFGTEGEVEVGRNSLVTKPGSLKREKIKPSESKVYRSKDHYLDWLTAIRNRTRPICDVEIGHRTATVCNLVNIAYELNRPLQWDPENEKFKDDPEANTFLSRPMRKEWAI